MSHVQPASRTTGMPLVKFLLGEFKPRGPWSIPFTAIPLPILVTGLVYIVIRSIDALGSMTCVPREFPLGIWIGFDVAKGVALAGGACAVASMVYVFQMTPYRSIVRATALNGPRPEPAGHRYLPGLGGGLVRTPSLLPHAAFAVLLLLLSGMTLPARAQQDAAAPAPIPDATCLACHAAAVPEDAWKLSAHAAKAGFGCQAVCHRDVQTIEHAGTPLAATACETCHPDWTSRGQALASSVHGAFGLRCAQCHDPHTAGAMALPPPAGTAGCTGCHARPDLVTAHALFVRAEVHLDGLSCARCHGDVHAIRADGVPSTDCGACHGDRGAWLDSFADEHAWNPDAALHLEVLGCAVCHRSDGRVKRCEDCHAPESILTGDQHEHRATLPENGDVLDRYGYMIGANRMMALDAAGLLMVAAAALFAVLHGALRILTHARRH